MKSTSVWRIAAAGAVLTLSAGVVVPAGLVVHAAPTDVAQRPANPNDVLLAVDVLQTITVQNEYSRGYRRSFFRHWIDTTGDGCDAREKVLKRDAIGFAQVDPFRCTVVEADWVSPYDGRRTTERSEVDIDHVVALKEAWESGAWLWDESRRTAFANDTTDARTLLAVSSSSNRSKGDRDPSNWMPPLRSYWCTYTANWISVKARWQLSMDRSEWGRLNNLLNGQCRGTTMRGWTAPPTGGGTGSETGASGTTPSVGSPTTVPADTRGSASTTSTTAAQSTSRYRPGQFCTPEGATTVINAKPYRCARTNADGVPYKDNRARWREDR
jgi:hypothetical protein